MDCKIKSIINEIRLIIFGKDFPCVSHYDVIIVGAGIIGLSSAYYIKMRDSSLRILVVDKQPTYAQGNTGRSAAGFRDLFTSDINFNLSHSSIAFYRHVNENELDIGMKFVGYLFLLPEKNDLDEYWASLSKKTPLREIQESDLSKIKALRLIPDKETGDLISAPAVTHAVIGENCGIVEPDLICKYYYDHLRSMEVEFMFSTEVKGLRLVPESPLNYPGEPFLWQKKTIGSILTDRGELTAEQFILATDVWTGALTDPVGIDSHVRPKKREIFQVSGDVAENILHTEGLNDYGILPFTIMPKSGVYIRPAPKERSLWIGVADNIGRSFSFEEDPQADADFYQMNLRPVMEAYWRNYDKTKVTSMWAGHYCYNTLDKAPFIFRSMNTVIADGTSGSGILKGDSIGRFVSSAFFSDDKVKLYDGTVMETAALGVEGRNVPVEKIIL